MVDFYKDEECSQGIDGALSDVRFSVFDTKHFFDTTPLYIKGDGEEKNLHITLTSSVEGVSMEYNGSSVKRFRPIYTSRETVGDGSYRYDLVDASGLNIGDFITNTNAYEVAKVIDISGNKITITSDLGEYNEPDFFTLLPVGDIKTNAKAITIKRDFDPARFSKEAYTNIYLTAFWDI